MTQKRKTRRSAARKTKCISVEHPDMRCAWILMQSLTCQLIKKLDAALNTHDVTGEGWERLFGAKDSTVVNLQKLVGVLAEISDRLAVPATSDGAGTQSELISMQPEDLLMLQRWLQQELSDMQSASV